MTRICLCCGVAVNSCTIGADLLDEELRKRRISGVKLEKCHVQDVASWLPRADVIVSFVRWTAETDKPVINGVPLMAGGRKQRQAVIEEILAHVPEAKGK